MAYDFGGYSYTNGAATSLAFQAGGALTSVIGAYASAQAMRTQADIAETNARLSELGAQAALLQGQHDEQASRLATADLKGRQRVAFAANGLDLGTGSAARVLATTDLLGEIDANTIKANAMRTAFGYRTQGLSYTNDAAARRASSSPYLGVASSLLGSGQQVASSWYQLAKTGAITRSSEP